MKDEGASSACRILLRDGALHLLRMRAEVYGPDSEERIDDALTAGDRTQKCIPLLNRMAYSLPLHDAARFQPFRIRSIHSRCGPTRMPCVSPPQLRPLTGDDQLVMAATVVPDAIGPPESPWHALAVPDPSAQSRILLGP